MNRIMLITGFFLIGATVPQEIAPIREFRQKIDVYDASITNRWFANEDALEFWKIGDELIVSLFNDELKDVKPSVRFKDIPSEYIDNIRIITNDNGGFSISYKPHRPPGDAAQEFRISANPLPGNEHLYIVRFTRDWWLGPNCEGSLIVAGTFRIFGKNKSSGRYEELAKFEESNFYKNIIMKQKFKNYTGEIQPPYMWCPSVDLKSVRLSKRKIFFDSSFGFSMIGYPPKSTMTVSWQFDLENDKLKATEYLYHPYSENEPNLEIDQRMKKGEPVPIP